jgi:hypothetical protein
MILVTATVLLAACSYDHQDAKQREASHAKSIPSASAIVDPDAPHDLFETNRGQGLRYAAEVEYFYEPSTGYCFAAMNHDRSMSLATVACDKVKHRLLNPPPSSPE